MRKLINNLYRTQIVPGEEKKSEENQSSQTNESFLIENVIKIQSHGKISLKMKTFFVLSAFFSLC